MLESQRYQPLPIGEMLQSFNHHYENEQVCLVPRSPEIDTALQTCLTSAEQRRKITSLILLTTP